MQPSFDKGGLSGPFGRVDPSLPQVFGRYLLVQRLSRGGMGEIFLAKHGLAGFEKLAVIKKVLPHLAADEQFILRFVDEAQVAIKLQHVNVAQVFEVGRVGDEYFLALEYVDGRDLRRTLAVLGHRKQRMPVDLGLFIARELANGLAYAHRRTAADGSSLNLVHCDISPPNVLVSFEGETKVIDFGIAKSAMRGSATDPKVGFGKFGYMAPEQLIRGGVVDHRTDLYAAGVVLYELLTGARLYEAGPEPDYRALARKVARGEHQLPSAIDPMLAPYDELVATALRPKPEERYQSAAELRDAIQQCLVAVNPTISTDQLGAYMRELFSDEMTAQHELHERVANAHLADFQEQFHTQTISTVSFALAQLPLQAPDTSDRFARRKKTTPPAVPRTRTGPTALARTTGPNPRVRTGPNPIAPPVLVDVDAQALGAIEPLDDTQVPTEAVEEQPTPWRKRALMVGASAALVVLAILGLRGLSTTEGSTPVAPTNLPVADPPKITVEPIPVEPHAIDRPIEPPARDSKPSAVAQPDHRPARDAVRKTGRKDPKPTQTAAAKPAPPPAPPPFTHEQLSQKYQQVSREYERYKARNGARLDNDWFEINQVIIYSPPSDDAGRREAARRLDAFRARLRE